MHNRVSTMAGRFTSKQITEIDFNTSHLVINNHNPHLQEWQVY